MVILGELFRQTMLSFAVFAILVGWMSFYCMSEMKIAIHVY